MNLFKLPRSATSPVIISGHNATIFEDLFHYLLFIPSLSLSLSLLVGELATGSGEVDAKGLPGIHDFRGENRILHDDECSLTETEILPQVCFLSEWVSA